MQYTDFATYAIACEIVCSHITGIPITVQAYSVHCWPRKYSMSRFSAHTLRPYTPAMPTRRKSTVESCRRRQYVLDFSINSLFVIIDINENILQCIHTVHT